MLKRLTALLLASTAGPAHGEITLIPPYDENQVLGVEILTPEDFGMQLTVAIFEDPRQASPQRVREIIEELDLRTPLGRPVVDVLIHPGTGDFIGIDRGSIELVGTLPDNAVIVSARDAQGHFAAVSQTALAWSRPNGEPVCYDLVDIADTDAPMGFTLLVDRSGSMDAVIDDVVTTTNHFLDLLPGNARCTLITFADEWTALTPWPAPYCREVRLDPTITAGGTTDIFGPLEAAYAAYARPTFDTWQTAVIVITDGVDTEAGDRADRIRSRLAGLKDDTRTFVFWLGNHTDAYLVGLADYFIARQGDVAGYLEGVYGTLGEAYRRQQVLRPRPCTP